MSESAFARWPLKVTVDSCRDGKCSDGKHGSPAASITFASADSVITGFGTCANK